MPSIFEVVETSAHMGEDLRFTSNKTSPIVFFQTTSVTVRVQNYRCRLDCLRSPSSTTTAAARASRRDSIVGMLATVPKYLSSVYSFTIVRCHWTTQG